MELLRGYTDNISTLMRNHPRLRRKLMGSCLAAVMAATGATAVSGTSLAQDLEVVPFLTAENDSATLAAFKNIFQAYSNEHPDVVIDIVLAAYGDIGRRITTAAAIGSDMGLLSIPNRYINDFANAGLLEPIDDVVASIGEDQFAPGAVFRGVDGKAYALAYAGATHGTVWVREDMMQEAGIKEPTNYEEFLAAAEKLTRDTNGDGALDVYGFGIPGGADAATDARFATFLYQNCGDFYDWNGNLVFDKPQALEAVKRYVAMFKYSPPGAAGWSFLDGIDSFIGGRIAMHPYGGRLGNNLERAAPEIRAKTRAIPLRVGTVEASRGGWDYLAVYSKARYPDVTKEVLKHFLSPEQLKLVSLTVPGHMIPPIKSVGEAVLASDDSYVKKYPDDVRTLFQVGSHVADPPLNMGAVDLATCKFDPQPNPTPWANTIYSGSPTVISEMIQRIVVDGQTPEEAWKWAYTRLDDVAKEWKAANPNWTPPPPHH